MTIFLFSKEKGLFSGPVKEIPLESLSLLLESTQRCTVGVDTHNKPFLLRTSPPCSQSPILLLKHSRICFSKEVAVILIVSVQSCMSRLLFAKYFNFR